MTDANFASEHFDNHMLFRHDAVHKLRVDLHAARGPYDAVPHLGHGDSDDTGGGHGRRVADHLFPSYAYPRAREIVPVICARAPAASAPRQGVTVVLRAQVLGRPDKAKNDSPPVAAADGESVVRANGLLV